MPHDRSAQPPSDALPLDLLQDTAATFGLLSATVRLHIVWLLAAGERDVGTLADEVGQSVATVSHHLAKLRLAGLVRARREGKRQVYLVDDPHVVEIVQRAVRHHDDLRDSPARRRRAHGA
ncbi:MULTISPECIES: metalloregulator ArsR/SmtB family transcription factor [unclassified Pseudofrankia]|uniref:ArsR/SmtB family transcription factor n=1 Tax=unclassified Pseudofrankia TaxID=2994372 RepID=UPI0008DABFD3|nr:MULTISPECIES: metalloregulator ArsR/SmtB family transcription factor [unclassified Pseudofrankia]MDT3442595.1 metalloregulator ArsR/SmtB family transcription factor [Pseudofrankia sp. BMG5.37]OHV71754.1 transcriptional regulator [Pseudofrankia sp. BMG5.36]